MGRCPRAKGSPRIPRPRDSSWVNSPCNQPTCNHYNCNQNMLVGLAMLSKCRIEDHTWFKRNLWLQLQRLQSAGDMRSCSVTWAYPLAHSHHNSQQHTAQQVGQSSTYDPKLAHAATHIGRTCAVENPQSRVEEFAVSHQAVIPTPNNKNVLGSIPITFEFLRI